jgi:predicted thioesterase
MQRIRIVNTIAGQQFAARLFILDKNTPISLMNALVPGLTGTAADRVTVENTAAHWGSGDVTGFATPALVLLMENAAFNATGERLPAGQTSVGIEINIRHLAATPIGMAVRARAELTQVQGRILTFHVEAWDDVEKIGEGMHVRSVVELAGFDKRMSEKKERLKTQDE